MKNNIFEIIVGTFVLICASYFFIFSYSKVNKIGSEKYQIFAQFDNVDGVDSGSDIKISGVKIGTVDSQSLDTASYRAKVTLNINKEIKLPKDSSAKIASSGLLGGKYISIFPGAEDEMLKNGDSINFTQSSVNFEDLLGKFIFGITKDQKPAGSNKANADAK